ncbi:MAG: sulfatase-like hydrolase/transferase [Gemmatimonadota bacterium]
MSVPAEPRPGAKPITVLVLAAWFGLLTGIVESFILAIRSFGLGQLIHVSLDFPWMAPIADVMLFLLPGIPLAILALMFRRGIAFRLLVFIYVSMGTGAILLMYPKIYPYASVVLAAGVGFQISRTLSRHQRGLERFATRSIGLLAGIVLLVALGMIGYRRLSERRSLSGAPAPRAGGRNVLLIILDTVRAANLSLYGYDRPTTPNLQRLAATGVRFDAAISAAPWTLPSHASLITGHWPHELSADWVSALDDRQATLAEYFDRQGYTTAGFVANVGYCSWEFGLKRGFMHYQDYPISWRTILESSSIGRQMDRSYLIRGLLKTDQHLVRVAAPAINQGFLEWVDNRGSRPFFAMLNFYDAHGPYLPPAPFDRMFAPGGRDTDLSPLHRFLARPRRTPPAANVIDREIAQYDGALAYLDQQLGVLFRELDQRGLLQNTVVVITADHGEEFGEHGVFDHGNSLYRPSVHVPLIVVSRDHVPPGRSVSTPVSLRNIAHTLADLATPTDPSPFPGFSLARYWTDSLAPAEPLVSEVSQGLRTPAWYPVSRGNMKAVMADDLRLIRNGDGIEELYRAADEIEGTDLARESSLTGRMNVLRDVLKVLGAEH